MLLNYLCAVFLNDEITDEWLEWLAEHKTKWKSLRIKRKAATSFARSCTPPLPVPPTTSRPAKKPRKMQAEEKWEFLCECGVSGVNVDDGSEQWQCMRCHRWAHAACIRKYAGDTKLRSRHYKSCFKCRKEETQCVTFGGGDVTVSEGILSDSLPDDTFLALFSFLPPVAPPTLLLVSRFMLFLIPQAL